MAWIEANNVILFYVSPYYDRLSWQYSPPLSFKNVFACAILSNQATPCLNVMIYLFFSKSEW